MFFCVFIIMYLKNARHVLFSHCEVTKFLLAIHTNPVIKLSKHIVPNTSIVIMVK